MQQAISSHTVLALDVGGQRIGVAEANRIARMAHPLTTLQHTEAIFDDIAALIKKQDAGVLVVGLPRNLSGDATPQTKTVQAFVQQLQTKISVPVYWQDEALTSQKAEDELKTRRKPYEKGDIDALAATFILEDFLRESGDKL